MTLLICLALTALALLATVSAARRRRPAAATRLLALALLPVAAYLTGLLTLGTRIGDAVVDWALGVTLNPVTWVGIALLGVAVVLFVGSGLVSARGKSRQARRQAGRGERRDRASLTNDAQQSGVPAGQDELAEIEEILRRRGI